MSRYDWNNPPPPGIDLEPPEEERSSEHRGMSLELSPQYDEYKDKIRVRSRSKSPDRRRRRHRSKSHTRRSRSYSRERRRRSRSRSRRRRRKHSLSRSRSRSPSYRHRHKHRRHSRSKSRSSRRRSHRSRSRSYRSRRSPKDERRDYYSDKELDGDIVKEEDMKIEDADDADEQSDSESVPVPFKNDGTFLEMFKKMQEEKAKEEEPESAIPKKPVLPTFGKRRGGKVLKTGLVAKVRNVEEEQTNAQDAWSVYMKEVRKYKEVHCDDDSKTRPLVK